MPLRYILPRRARIWYEGHSSTVGYVFLVCVILAVGGYAYNGLSDNDSQFCHVAAQRLTDKQSQVVQTNEYLVTLAGQEPTAFNTYIRQVSLPRLREEIASDKEALPDSCRDEYDDLAAKQNP